MDVPWLLDTLGVRHTAPSAEKLAALLEPLAAAEPARPSSARAGKAQAEKVRAEKLRAEKLRAEKASAPEPVDTPAAAPQTVAVADDDGMVRSDALAAISDLNADEADDDDPQRGRRIMGLLFASGSGKDGGGGKRGKGKRRTA
jgi:hypothetical protein